MGMPGLPGTNGPPGATGPIGEIVSNCIVHRLCIESN